jgi:hypothetical protein
MMSMAEPAAANDAAQRYAAIEKAYSKEDWATVLKQGEVLLQELEADGLEQFQGLRMRLQLLLGHTQLYGFGAKEKASSLYGIVAKDSSEQALARIAEQGLKQCTVTAAEEPQVAATPTEPTASTASPAVGPSQSAAAPWLEATTATKTDKASSQEGAGPTIPALPFSGTVDNVPSTAAAITVETSSIPLPLEAAAAAGESAGPPTPWGEASLIPEIVEEPELIELHQADPSLAEEVEVTWKDKRRSVEGDDQDLLSGLLLVRIG